MTNKSKKKILSICLVVAMMATLVVGGTLAYFHDEDSATNTFTIGEKIGLTLTESSEELPIQGETPIPGKHKQDGGLEYKTPAYPGACFAKVPRVTLTGESAHVYMELTMQKAQYEALNQALTGGVKTWIWDVVKFGDGSSVPKLVGLKKADSEKGTKDVCGVVFYYGNMGPIENYPLMAGVKFPATIDNDGMDKIYNANEGTLDLTVTAYAVQYTGLEKEEDAFNAFFLDKGYEAIS